MIDWLIKMKLFILRALGSSLLGLPVVVARAHCFVTIVAWWYTQAFVATLLTEKHARLVVLCPSTSPRTLWWTFWSFHIHQKTKIIIKLLKVNLTNGHFFFTHHYVVKTLQQKQLLPEKYLTMVHVIDWEEYFVHCNL